ncbi:MAG: c-type cytochrome [Terriglobia bacterium]|jgi:cytochrome c oxidase cbb3-type subunit 3
MTIGTRLFLKLFVLGCVASAFAFQAAAPPSGSSIFKRRCMMCHGADGKGFPTVKTPDFTDPKWQASMKDKDLMETIKNGKKGTHMPPFGDKLSEDEIKAVIGHIRSLKAEKK